MLCLTYDKATALVSYGRVNKSHIWDIKNRDSKSSNEMEWGWKIFGGPSTPPYTYHIYQEVYVPYVMS